MGREGVRFGLSVLFGKGAGKRCFEFEMLSTSGMREVFVLEERETVCVLRFCLYRPR